MKIKWFLNVMIAFALFSTLAYGDQTFTDMAKEKKVRAFWSSPKGLFEPLKEAGINTLIQRIELTANEDLRKNGMAEPSISFFQAENYLTSASSWCKQNDLYLLYALGIAATPTSVAEAFRNNPRRYHDGLQPCPLDMTYWDRMVTNRFLHAVKLLSGPEYRLDGLIIDPEMYQFTGGFITIPCYCHHCAADYGAITRNDALLEQSKDKRGEWLKSNDLYDRYERWQCDVFLAMVVDMRRQIEAVKRGLVFGNLFYMHNPWFKTLVKGLATESMPVVVLQELTYGGHFNESYIRMQEVTRKQIAVPVLLCPGISLSPTGGDRLVTRNQIPVEYLKVVPGNLYHRTMLDDGYFVYAGGRWGGTRKGAEPYTKALRQVNTELDRYAASGGTYHCELKPQSPPLEVPVNLESMLQSGRAWRRVDSVSQRVPKPEGQLAFRFERLIIFKAKAGQEITLKLETIPYGVVTAEARAVVYDPWMRVIADEVAPIGRPNTYKFQARDEGAYAIFASAGSEGANAYAFDIEPVPWVLAEEAIGFNSVNGKARRGRVYFHIPEKQKNVNLNLGGHPIETVSFKVYDPQGAKVLEIKDSKGWKTHRVPSDGKGGIWCVELFDIVDDAAFGVEGVNRYALDPVDLLIED